MKQLLAVFLTFLTINSHAQNADKFNLGFEHKHPDSTLSDGWVKWGTSKVSISDEAHSGKKAVKISSTDENSYGFVSYQIPEKYNGKKIRLTGYMKTKDVGNGFCGLVARIDGQSSTLDFQTMENDKISGTKDWQKFSITVKYPKEAEFVIVAGMLNGVGEVWFDDFVVTIDGKNVQTLSEVEKQLTNAQQDKDFKRSRKAINECSTRQRI
jgi:ribosomal protein S6E (S10)